MDLFTFNGNMQENEAYSGFAGSDQVAALFKALEAGTGTDAATFTNGRALQPENLENVLVEALFDNKKDYKLTSRLKNVPVASSVHQFDRQLDVGDSSMIFHAEGADTRETNQSIDRVVRSMKYMQTLRKTTLQIQTAKTIVNPEQSEELAGTRVLLRGIEAGLFHGDEAAVPTQFDSIPKQIKAAAKRNILDLRGTRVTTAGFEDKLSEIMQAIFESGGDPSISFMPSIIAKDFQDLARERLRFGTDDKKLSTVFETYPTLFGDLKIAGDDAGPNKFYRTKGLITPGGTTDRPNAPTFALLAEAKTAGTGFIASTAGTYRYSVYAVSEDGISDAATLANVAVAAGEQVKITITHDGTKPGTGFIIVRGKKDVTTGTTLYEMMRVGKTPNSATTVALDQNDELPGTGEILILTDNGMQPTVQWDQFLPMIKVRMFPTKALVSPFIMAIFGSPDTKVPWFNGIIKNISPSTLDWYA